MDFVNDHLLYKWKCLSVNMTLSDFVTYIYDKIPAAQVGMGKYLPIEMRDPVFLQQRKIFTPPAKNLTSASLKIFLA